MSRQSASQKKHEQFFVDKAAELMGKVWTLKDCECPDFIVTEGTHQFGLEVRDIFTGLKNKAGSKMKKTESKTQKSINVLRLEYKEATGIQLIVKFVGDMCDENMAEVVPGLVAKDISSRPIGYQDHIDIDKGGGRLRIYFTSALSARWFCVNHRAGWVNTEPIKLINNAIEEKSKNLPRYRGTAGSDIRLLIVANRTYNSGKLMLGKAATPVLRGFRVVYFFSYPLSVKIFGCCDN